MKDKPAYANFYFHGCPHEGDAYFDALDAKRLEREELAARCEAQGLMLDGTAEDG